MKKIVVSIIAIVIIILVIVLFKNFTDTKYSHEDIKSLISKGLETMNSANNMYFEKEAELQSIKYYYKENKMKMIVSGNYTDVTNNTSSTVITNLEEGKKYWINEKTRKMAITNTTTLDKNFQSKFFQSIEEYNDNTHRYELAYIRDEKLDNRDCIFVKQQVFNIETNKYSDPTYNSTGDIPVCWIEKSTGFVIGTGVMQSGNNVAILKTLITNIQFGKVIDSDFDLPNGYEIVDFYKP